ncbi:hypothetical protein N7474_003972 [Penicillium riverlandense]|uniref:uncharacterized protein n=1 Tax=Penicillium riverlandense TaxID=1903569 RepID=UPI0025470D8B|nr:uncharacterized protein N7474_003972 [Penicillium riverlandense]KAJ5818381.1 hypothetical protein N7474_003972 [Penicillium riverlandense]
MVHRRRPKKLRLLLLSLIHPASAAVPYAPSSLFLSPQHNDSLAYLLQPSSSGTGATEFLSLNLSSSVDAGSPSYHTLLERTPFQSNDGTSTFVPVINDQGAITVYSGDCHPSSPNPDLWRFRPHKPSSIGNGTWERLSLSSDKNRPNYLAAGFTFSSTNTNEASIFVFGGMCPFQNSTNGSWISAATYSQSTIMLNPTGPHSNDYQSSTTGARAPPIPEAGSAIVPLSATYSAASTNKQQDFLLIGGHTQNAFLNMSELAVFSLPQESWSFVSVNKDSTSRTELAIREQAMVEPRSGHTALLSQDGRKVFVLGGWVGDTSVPAEPQFAVLTLGEDYSGTDWSWTIPSSNGLGLPEGTGIFGHAAAMLPGDVMMIAGGYSIPKQSSKRAVPTARKNSQVYLYNVTSDSWVTSYTNPEAHHKAASTSSGGDGLSTGQKVGLGLGLGFGIPVLITLILFGWMLWRKRIVRNKRDSQLRDLALGAERAHFWGRDDPFQASSVQSSQMSEKQDPATAYPWTGNRGYGGRPNWRDPGGSSPERTGLLRDAGSPSKPGHQPHMNARPYRSPGATHYRRSDQTSEIHPIDEREEDEAIFRERLMATIPLEERHEPSEHGDLFTEDPFATPRSTIFGVGLGPFYSRRKDAGSVDLDGRSSPAKSDRTSTNLSESSAASFLSFRPAGHIAQVRAMITERPLSWASSGGHSFEHLAVASTASRETTHSDPDGLPAPSEKSLSGDSYSTAQTTITQRQAENEALLFDESDANPSLQSSPSKLPRESKPRASDWMMQTMRRALTLTRRGTNSFREASFAPLASGIDRRSTVIGSGADAHDPNANTPRRAVSASAELFRRKQGAKDWGANKRVSDDVFSTPRLTRDDLFLGAPGYLGDDDDGNYDIDDDDHDWDVEGAAEGRRVQVTFTVPREKLRVVNATAGDLDNISERSLSRSFSDAPGSLSRRKVSA